MKKMLPLLFVALIAFFVGYYYVFEGDSPQRRIAQIKQGMPVGRVVDLMGPPNHLLSAIQTVDDDADECLAWGWRFEHYPVGATFIHLHVMAKNGRVLRVTSSERPINF